MLCACSATQTDPKSMSSKAEQVERLLSREDRGILGGIHASSPTVMIRLAYVVNNYEFSHFRPISYLSVDLELFNVQ